MIDEPKQSAPVPDIPDEIRSKLSTPKRPGGFTPKSPEADGNPPLEEEERHEKNLKPFFKKLKEAMEGGKFYRTEIVEREAKVWNAKLKEHEFIREKRSVKVEVEMALGTDGLPYVTGPVGSDETRRVRQLTYKDAPPVDPNFGDLTPAFAEWLFLNHPYDAAVRYFGRSTHVQAWAVAHN